VDSLLVERLVFTPHHGEDGRYDYFTGQGTLTALLAGTAVTGKLVTPAGFDRLWTSGFRGVLRVA
jgi:hypothetical protein